MKIEPRMFTLPNGEVLTVRSLCADDAEAECIPQCNLQRNTFYGPIPGGRSESGSDAELARRLRGKPCEL